MKINKELLNQIANMSETECWQPYEVKFFGPTTRTLSFFNEVNRETAHVLISQMLQLAEDDPDEPITILLNTEGGSLTDGMAIYDAIVNISCPVLILVSGLCASAGLIILSAGDYRIATKSCTFYYHQPVMEEKFINSIKDMNELNKFYSYCKAQMDDILKEKTKMSDKKWLKNFEGKTSFYFSTQNALKYNLIDEIQESNKIDFNIKDDDD